MVASSLTIVGDDGAVITGISFTVIFNTPVFESVLPSLDVKLIDAAPVKLAVGVNVAASNAVFIAANVPDIVKSSLLLAPSVPPKVIPVVPVVTIPLVTTIVTVWASPSESATLISSFKATLVASSLTIVGDDGAVKTGVCAITVPKHINKPNESIILLISAVVS